MTTTALGVIGAGRVARSHANAIAEHPRARLGAVTDPNMEAASQLASEFDDVLVLPDREALWNTRGIDAVIVCAPTAMHHEIAIDAARNGKHALIEKPLAVELHKAIEMVDAAEQAGTQLMSGQVMRFMPMFVWAKEFVQAGKLGKPIQAIERRLTYRREHFPWWSELPNFLVSHWGSHSLDLMSYLLGDELTEAYCHGTSEVETFPGIDDFNLQARFRNGCRIGIHMSSSARQTIHDLIVIGEDATLDFSCYTSVRLNGEPQLQAPESRMLADGFLAQLDNFIQAIEGRESLKASGASVLPSTAALEAAGKSIRSGQVERISQLAR